MPYLIDAWAARENAEDDYQRWLDENGISRAASVEISLSDETDARVWIFTADSDRGFLTGTRWRLVVTPLPESLRPYRLVRVPLDAAVQHNLVTV